MVDEEPARSVVEVIEVLAIGAAMLQAWGCPPAAVDSQEVLLPDRFDAFGVAVIGAVAVDGSGVLHSVRCRGAWTARPVELPDLLLLPPWTCSIGCAREIRLALDPAVGGPAEADIKLLAAGLHHAVSEHPPMPVPGLEAEVRTVRFGRAVREVLRRFLDEAVAPAALFDAVDKYDRWIGGQVAEHLAGLRRDGMDRLIELLAAEIAIPDGADLSTADMHRGALADAERAIPGGPGDEVVCLLRLVTRFGDTAVTASAVSAIRPATLGGVLDAGIAVVPRHLAVLLHALYAISVVVHVDEVLVHVDVVDPALPGLRQVCESALELWSTGADDPASVWRACLAAAL